MSDILKTLFERPTEKRRSCRIVGKHSAGSYIVLDELGRSFIATGDPGFRQRQQVVVIGAVIVGTGLAGRAAATVMV